MNERRLVAPDVVRAIALVGVVVMNYHGYLNGADAAAGPDSSVWERWFDPFRGVLSTRFAATFVLVAGIGVTLMTRNAVARQDKDELVVLRWRLARRGLTLYIAGAALEWIWPGTILFFYGAYFVIAAALFTLGTRSVVASGAAAALAAAGLQLWSTWQTASGHDVGWLYPDSLDSFRNVMLRTFVGYTHPVLPWLAFFCAGIVLGRALPHFDRVRWRVAGVAAAALVATYTLSTVVARAAGPATPDDGRGFWRDEGWRVLTSTRPMDRGLLYVVGTVGSSILAYCLISALAERHPESAPVDLLRRAGALSLSIYLAHVFVFNGAVDWGRWVGGDGLGVALAFAGVFWLFALLAAAWWHRFVSPLGPAEWLYRRLGG